MSTSLGSNTYNRQNWEDAVSGAAARGRSSREGRAWAGGALLRRGSAGGGKAARRAECGEAAPGLGPALGTLRLPWGFATCHGGPLSSLGTRHLRMSRPGGLCRGSLALLAAQRERAARRSFPRAAVRGWSSCGTELGPSGAPGRVPSS